LYLQKVESKKESNNRYTLQNFLKGYWMPKHGDPNPKHRPTPDDIIACSSDYLGLTTDPRIAAAKIHYFEGLVDHPESAPRTSYIYSRADDEDTAHPLRKMERAYAEFMGAEDAVYFSSGVSANMAAMDILCGGKESNIPIYIDQHAHNSLYKGLSAAGVDEKRLKQLGGYIRFKHNDVEDLKKKMDKHRGGFIIVDAIYSTNGDFAPLKEIRALAEAQGDCILVVDEAHSFGVYGKNGEGYGPQFLSGSAVPVLYTISLSKAVGQVGGMVLGPKAEIDAISQNSGMLIFSTITLPEVIVGCQAALEIIKSNPNLGKEVQACAKNVITGLQKAGFPVWSDGHILSFPIDPPNTGHHQLDMVDQYLRDAYRLFTSPFGPPAQASPGARFSFSQATVPYQSEIPQIFDHLKNQPGIRIQDWQCLKRPDPRAVKVMGGPASITASATPFCFCTTQKHLTVKISSISMV